MRTVLIWGVPVGLGALIGWFACDMYAHMFDWGDNIATPLCWKGAGVGAVAGALLAGCVQLIRKRSR